MQRLAGRLEKVQPEVRQQFVQLAEQAAQRASKSNPKPGAPEASETAQTTPIEPLVARRELIAEPPPVNQTKPEPRPTP
jgi:uncharacterized caspase-like protein